MGGSVTPKPNWGAAVKASPLESLVEGRHPETSLLRPRCRECWHMTADEAVGYFFGPLNWVREEEVVR